VRLAAFQQRDVRAGAAHVEGDEIPSPITRAQCRFRRCRRRPGEHGAGGQAHGVLDGGDAAMRLHDEHAAGIAGLLQPRVEPAEIARQHGSHVSVHHRGPEALVLLDLREHLGGQRYVGRREQPREEPAGGLLVSSVTVGVEIADRDGLDLGRGSFRTADSTDPLSRGVSTLPSKRIRSRTSSRRARGTSGTGGGMRRL
jgi:hypothetical protein